MKSIAKWAVFVPLFIIPFLPLYVETSLFFPYIAGKGFAFRILVEIAAAGFVLLALADKAYRPKWSWTLLIYMALVAWMFIADLFAVNPDKAFWSNYERMDGFVTLIHVFVLFVVAGSVLSQKLWKRWWLTVLAASSVVAIHGVLQLAGTLQIHQGGVRLDANFGNAAYLAAYLLFIIAIALWQAIEAKGWLRYVLFALATLQTILLFATATRGAVLGFVGASVLGAVLWAFQSGKQGRRIGAGVLVGILVLIGGFYLARDSAFIQENPALTRIASISVADGSTRFTLWHMAFEGVMERPVLGWGHEGFGYVFTKYFDPSLYAQEPWFDRAHNVFIDWMVYGGIPAFLLFVALLISGVVGLWRAPLTKLERVMLTCALAAYAFQALFVFDNLLSYILAAGILAVAHAGTAKPWKALEELPVIPESTLTSAVAPTMLVLLAVTIYFVNVPGIIGGQKLILAARSAQTPSEALVAYKEALQSGTFAMQEVREQVIGYASNIVRASGVTDDVKQSALALAVPEIQKEFTRVPEDVRTRLMYAQVLESTGDFNGALQVMETARALSPKKQSILVQMGVEAWKVGLSEEQAEVYFQEAYALDTSFQEPAAYIAAGKFISGDVAGAQGVLVEAYGTTTVDHDILRFAYIQTKRYDDLIASAQLLVEHSGGNAASTFYLARVYATAGLLNEARATIEETIKKHPEAKAEGEQYLKQIDQSK